MGAQGASAMPAVAKAGFASEQKAGAENGVTLAERRALVRSQTSLAAEQARNRAMTGRAAGKHSGLTLKQMRELASRAHARAERMRLATAPLTSASSVDAFPENHWITGPTGLISSECEDYSTCEAGLGTGQSNVIGTLYTGEQVTVTSGAYTLDTAGTMDQVQVSWTENCGGVSYGTVGTSTVSAPSWYSGGPPAYASASFTITSACGSSSPPDGDPQVNFEIEVNETVVGGGSGGDFILGSWLSQMPPQQISSVICEMDSVTPGPAQQYAADPVSTATGAYSESVTDATLKTPGYPLQICRTYSSADTASGSLGPGWSLSWEAHLAADSSTGDVALTAENGDQYVYTPNGSGGFNPPDGARSVLAETTDSSGNATGFTLTAPDNHVLKFSASGQLQSELDATGRGLTFSYNSSGQVSSITDAAGQSVTLTYTGSLLSAVGLPDGQAVAYAYTNGYLTSAVTPGGSSGARTSYSYTSTGLLASVEDPDGNTTRNTYDSSGRVTAQEDGAANTTSFSYTTTSSGLAETDVTSPGGGITTYLYGGGLLLQSTDPLSYTTVYDYNSYALPVQETDPLGRATQMSYDSSGNQLSETDPLGNRQQWSYDSHDNVLTHTDADGNATTYTYNSMDEPTSVTTPSGKKATYAYDPSGNLTSATDPRGKAATYSYNSAGQPASVTNADGSTTSYTYDAMGNPLTVTDPEGHVATYGYDAAERLASVTAPGGGVTGYSYDLGREPDLACRPGQQRLDILLRRR